MKRRIHVRLDPNLVRAIDALVGTGHRSSFVESAVRRRLDRARREDRDDLWGPERALWAREVR
jgi:Arc/MetJ-type ribon-helix-helix transcriptional regulator